MAEPLCATKAKLAIKAYFTDFWSKSSMIYENTKTEDRTEVKKEIVNYANRIIYLIGKQEEKPGGNT